MSLLHFFGIGGNKNYPALDRRDADSSQLLAPGTKILYDPNLIPQLVHDHGQLVAVYSTINKAIEKKLYHKIHGLLDTFLALFNKHALTEYTKLYVFLDYSLRPYSEQHQEIMRFRKEMQEIGKVVRQFVHEWKRVDINADKLSEFSSELQDIGSVLSKRITVEEKQLYQVYADAPKLLNAENTLTH